MGRNAKRRRERRNAILEGLGREVRTTVAERVGSRIRSVVHQLVGSGSVAPAKVKPKSVPLHAAALVAGMAAWGAPARGPAKQPPAVTSDPDPRPDTHS